MISENKPHKSKNILKRVGSILLKTILIIVLLIVTILILIQTPPVQNFLVKKATAFLEKKLKTRVEIGKIYIGFPKDIVLENIYVEDRKKDTLLSGGRLKIDIAMMKLLDSEIEVNEIKLDEITAKVSRLLPDTTYNFQFIVDAFASGEKKPEKKSDTAALKINVKHVQLNKIRLVYKDVITGNDMDVWLGYFDTRIDKFDLNNQHFDIPVTTISGIKGRIYQSKPLMKSEPAAKDAADAQKPSTMQLNFRKLQLKQIELDYRNDVSAFYTSLNLGELVLNVNKLDLPNRVIALQDLQLNNTFAAIRLGKKEAAKIVEKEVEQEIESQADANWRFTAESIRFNNNNLEFDNDNKPREKYGMDYAHLKARDLTLHLDNLLYSKDSISGIIKKASLKEQSGFQLNKWETDFLYANNEAYLKDLILQTPGTELKKSIVLRYPSLEALKKNIGALQMDVDLQNSKIQIKDILTFVPTLKSQPAFAKSSNTLRINGRIRGSVSRLQIETLQIHGLQDTRVNVRGTIGGLPDIKKTGANLTISEFSTSRRDIMALAPKGSLPAGVTLPERVKLTGRVTGGMNNINPDLLLSTSLGNVSIKGNIRQASDKIRAQYDAVVETRNLNLGIILQNQQNLGTLSAKFTAKGKGYDPKTANGSISGIIHSAIIKKYNYRNLQLNASIANQQVQAKMNIDDPNIDFSLDASGNLGGKFPAVRIVANIDSIKTFPLNLTTDSILYRGVITGDFPVTDPDHLQGNLLITKSLLVKGDQRLELDTLQVAAGNNDSGQYIHVTADAVNMQLQGKYKLTQLGTVFQQAIQPYFAIMPPGKPVTVEPYDFTFSGGVINKPILKTFLPAMERLEPVSLNGRFSSTGGWQMSMNAPLVIYGTNRVENLRLVAGTKENAIGITTTIERLTSGKSIALYSTSLDASIANNQVDFTLNIKDKEAKDKYTFSALFRQPQQGDYLFSIKPQQLLLNYDAWVVPGDNQIAILKTDINARNFVLTRNNQQLSINSLSQESNSPMEVKFANFKIATLANFVVSDSLPVDGTINGQVILNDLTKQPTFTSNLTISDVKVKNDTIGSVNIQVNNTVQNTFAADVKITGHGNDVQLTGNYYVKPDNNSSFDMNLDIRQILLNSVQGATMGAITNASGSLTGKFAINGTVKAPNVNGNLDFNKVAFNLTMLNSYFRIDEESIKIDNEGLRLNTFTIRDSSNNAAILDGVVYYNPGYTDYRFDLTLKAENFQALNTVKKVNQVYYGKLFFDSNLRILGTQLKPVVDGSITINEQTSLTVVLPQKEPGLQEREGIVVFVDMDAVPNDSLFMARYDSVNRSEVLGLDIAVNINIDKKAEFNLIVDEGNGDFLKVRGAATLSGGIDPSGKITLTGSYELEEGAYELSFNFLRRRFDIQKGSTIVWTGEPTKANVDITAGYVAKTAPYDLVASQLEGAEASASQKNYYRQKLPFQVDLKMKGELLKPQISFDIRLPSNVNYNLDKTKITNIETKLDQIRLDPSELNKQVFALLLLGRFVTENPFASSSGGFSAEGFARNSVSALLTEQLNNLASDLIKGVDLNFNLASTSEDYTTGNEQAQNRTDLNVALSKRLLNDRLIVTVGSNFELEGSQAAQPGGKSQRSNNLAGNVSVEYKLSKDGRYALRAYRKNEYEGVLQGYIIETGVGFVMTLDYNKFRQIFLTQKQREEKRTIKRQERELEEAERKKADAEQKQKSEADDRKKDIKTTNENSNE
ncbi:MAG: translocation/assembly module TamB domain-containing protein [Chitinophagaceae bacterium]